MYNMMLFRYRALGLPPEHPDCSKIFTEHGQKLGAPPHDIMISIHCDTSTVNTSTWYRGRKLLRATPPTSSLTRLSFLSCIKATDTETARLGKAQCSTGCNSAARLNFGNVFKNCVRGPLISILKHP